MVVEEKKHAFLETSDEWSKDDIEGEPDLANNEEEDEEEDEDKEDDADDDEEEDEEDADGFES